MDNVGVSVRELAAKPSSLWSCGMGSSQRDIPQQDTAILALLDCPRSGRIKILYSYLFEQACLDNTDRRLLSYC